MSVQKAVSASQFCRFVWYRETSLARCPKPITKTAPFVGCAPPASYIRWRAVTPAACQLEPVLATHFVHVAKWISASAWKFVPSARTRDAAFGRGFVLSATSWRQSFAVSRGWSDATGAGSTARGDGPAPALPTVATTAARTSESHSTHE